jgi:tetratricopeptide (TPR) repeat protein
VTGGTFPRPAAPSGPGSGSAVSRLSFPAPVFFLCLFLHAVCPLLFFTDHTRNPYAAQIHLLQGGLALAFALYIGIGWRRGRFDLRPAVLDVPLLILLCVALASWAVSWLSHPSLRPAVWNEGFRGFAFLAVNGVLPYWLAAQAARPDRDRRLRRLWLAVGSAAAAYGVLQYMGKEFLWPRDLNPYSGRPVSTFGNPNFLSSYLVMLMPAALAELLGARTRLGRAAAAAVFLAFSAAVVSTLTRSSWIGAAAAVGTFLWLTRDLWPARRRWVLGVLAVAAALALLWPASPLAGTPVRAAGRMAELAQGIAGGQPYGPWHQRLLIWSSAWDMVKDNPILGKGWGCFELFYPFYQGAHLSDETFRLFRTHANNAHNLVLEIWSQAGVLGLGLFLWAALLFWRTARRGVPLLPAEERPAAWALLAGGLGMLADNIFGNVSLFFAVPAFLFFWMTGALAGRVGGETRSYSARSPAALTAGVLLAALTLASAWRSFAHWRAEALYFAGFKKAKAGDLPAAIRNLEASRALRPREVNNNYELANVYARRARWASGNNLEGEAARLSEAAAAAYGEALEANAGYDEIYFNRASVLNRLGRREEAVLHYRTALLINPLSREAYKALGNLLLSDSSPEARGRELFERAVFYFPDDKEFWNNLGVFRARLGDHSSAAEAFSRALALDPAFAAAAQNLSLSRQATGR